MKTMLGHVGNELAAIPAVGLGGGPALYLFSYVALRLRVARRLSPCSDRARSGVAALRDRP